METRDLEYILAVHAHGGIGRAADALGISQPALTKAVRRVESQLGVTLFERSARGMSPTSAGLQFIDRARIIHRDVEDARKEMRGIQSGTQGVVSLGYTSSISDATVFDACRQLVQDRPAARLRLHRMMAPGLLDLLQEGTLDLVIAPVPTQRADQFVARALFDDPLTVVADESHPLRRQKNVQLADLVVHKWLLPGQQVLVRQQLDAAFRAQGLPAPYVQLETDHFSDSLFHLLRGLQLLSIGRPGMALAALGIHPVRLGTQELELGRQVSLVSRAGAYLSPLARRLSCIVEERFAARSTAPSRSGRPAAARWSGPGRS